MKLRRTIRPPVYDPNRSFRFSYDPTPKPVPAPTFLERINARADRLKKLAIIGVAGGIVVLIIGVAVNTKPTSKPESMKSSAFVSAPIAPPPAVAPEMQSIPDTPKGTIRRTTSQGYHDCGLVWVSGYRNSHGRWVNGYYRRHPRSRFCP